MARPNAEKPLSFRLLVFLFFVQFSTQKRARKSQKKCALKADMDIFLRVVHVSVPTHLPPTPFTKHRDFRLYKHNSFYIENFERQEKIRRNLAIFGLFRSLNEMCGREDFSSCRKTTDHRTNDHELRLVSLERYKKTVDLDEGVCLTVTVSEYRFLEKYKTLYTSEYFVGRKPNGEFEVLEDRFEEVCREILQPKMKTAAFCVFFVSGMDGLAHEHGGAIAIGRNYRVEKKRAKVTDSNDFASLKLAANRKVNQRFWGAVSAIEKIGKINALVEVYGEARLKLLFQNILLFVSVAGRDFSAAYIKSFLLKDFMPNLLEVDFSLAKKIKSAVLCSMVLLLLLIVVRDFKNARRGDNIQSFWPDLRKLLHQESKRVRKALKKSAKQKGSQIVEVFSTTLGNVKKYKPVKREVADKANTFDMNS